MVVLGLSGGLDSTVLLGHFLHQGDSVLCCVFDYGSTHGPHEQKAALAVADYYSSHFPGKVDVRFIEMGSVFSMSSSALLAANGQDIPEGEYNKDNMKRTVVPGRNLIFASVMAGIAESVGARAIALGIHSGDHDLYPDCTVQFAKALDTTIYLSSGGKVSVEAPFVHLTKADIVLKGHNFKFPAPFHLTRSCYQSSDKACGKCGTCRERLHAFRSLGLHDPVPYNKGE